VGIPLETGQKQYSVDYKLETYLKISRYRKFLIIFDLWNVEVEAMMVLSKYHISVQFFR
jgi:hypothetical protein